MVRIETERLILREYAVSDLEAIHRYTQREDILIYEAWGPNTLKQSEAWIQQSIEDSKKKPRTTFELTITVKPTGQLVGGCGFRIKKDNPTRGDFGYIINPNYWNRGYATEAALGIIQYMIENYSITELEATCDVLNIASQKVIQKCGLVIIKEIKGDVETKGRIRDTYLFERIID
jgi:ribosomal-protein-alanine N-acetyltransferase